VACHEKMGYMDGANLEISINDDEYYNSTNPFLFVAFFSSPFLFPPLTPKKGDQLLSSPTSHLSPPTPIHPLSRHTPPPSHPSRHTHSRPIIRPIITLLPRRQPNNTRTPIRAYNHNPPSLIMHMHNLAQHLRELPLVGLFLLPVETGECREAD
jgi:hypothetical protein